VKNFLNNFYIFSKLSIVVSLIILLIFLAYLFYQGYANQAKTESTEEKKVNEIVNLIKSNSNKIQELSLIIDNLNKSFTSELNKEDSINKISIEALDEIKNDISLLKNQFGKMESFVEINANKKPKVVIDEKNKTLLEVKELIRLKFINGDKFSPELELLNNYSFIENKAELEKLYILNESNFNGNDSLLSFFEQETDRYISNVIISDKNILKPLLSYVEIQPSKNKTLENKTIINLKKIGDLIMKKEYEKSLMILQSLKDYNKHFKITNEQLKIAKEFNNALEKIFVK
tara:strand:+ start:1511 stop:2377 length:867 start_codon:yes stop_codon:yes gene_type:complete